jgi:hypothetical protein
MSSEPQTDRTSRAALRWILAVFYVAAGLAHLTAPDKLAVAAPEITGGRHIWAVISLPGHDT